MNPLLLITILFFQCYQRTGLLNPFKQYFLLYDTRNKLVLGIQDHHICRYFCSYFNSYSRSGHLWLTLILNKLLFFMLGDLQKYYASSFPVDMFYDWLSYGSKTYFLNREFSFTLHNDVYLRFLNFKDANELKLALQTQSPIKIDIGAVYNDQPKHKKMQKLIPQEKELVFDLDLSDYDEIRTCCQGATCCNICWEYIRIALRVIKVGLERDFGFNKLLMVYSGRRGIHIWVCDKRARVLTDVVRSAILNYFSIIKGGADQHKKVNLPRLLHPSIQRSVELTKKTFLKMLDQQKTFVDKTQLDAILQLTQFDKVNDKPTIKERIEKATTLQDKYMCFVEGLGTAEITEIMLQYTYPRLDVNVSTKMNHLLKAPFCVHPKTGRICMPIWDIDGFNPTKCLTVSQVVETPDLLMNALGPFQGFLNSLKTEQHSAKQNRVVMALKNENDMTF